MDGNIVLFRRMGIAGRLPILLTTVTSPKFHYFGNGSENFHKRTSLRILPFCRRRLAFGRKIHGNKFKETFS